MAGCSFDMQFIFVWVGWEGSTHNTRMFLEAINNPHIKFPKPPKGINMCVCVLMLIFFLQFSFLYHYMFL